MPTDVRVTGEAAEVARAEVAAVLVSASPGPFRDRLNELSRDLEEGSVPGDRLEDLDRLLEIALQSGRIRAHYGPGGEAAAVRLYRRLPSGRALVDSAQDVSSALDVLRGRTLDGVAIAVNGPGSYSVRFTSGGLDLAVRLDRQGARLTTVEA